jgi:hypothetical protein
MTVARLHNALLSILMLPIFTCGVAEGEPFTSPGYYTMTVDGWQRSVSPNGLNYRCITCKEQVNIKIEYGPPLGSDAPWRMNESVHGFDLHCERAKAVCRGPDTAVAAE